MNPRRQVTAEIPVEGGAGTDGYLSRRERGKGDGDRSARLSELMGTVGDLQVLAAGDDHAPWGGGVRVGDDDRQRTDGSAADSASGHLGVGGYQIGESGRRGCPLARHWRRRGDRVRRALRCPKWRRLRRGCAARDERRQQGEPGKGSANSPGGPIHYQPPVTVVEDQSPEKSTYQVAARYAGRRSQGDPWVLAVMASQGLAH
jgi:hypothetical protein